MNTAQPSLVFDPRNAAASLEMLRDVADRGALRVDEVDLRSLAADFHGYIEETADVNLDDAGTFLQVMSRLLLSKSITLLPRPEVEEEDQVERGTSVTPTPFSLAPAVQTLAQLEGEECYMGEARVSAFPRISEPRSPGTLQRAWAEMQKRATSDRLKVSPPAFVRLETAVSRLIRGLRTSTRLSLRSLLHGANKNDAVIHFLAVLELIRRRQVTVVQNGLFGEIVLEPAEHDTDSDVRAG